jgi:3-phosphoglycerate kinase
VKILSFRNSDSRLNELIEQSSIVTMEEGIPDGDMSLDIGPESAKRFADVVLQSKTIVWNG